MKVRQTNSIGNFTFHLGFLLGNVKIIFIKDHIVKKTIITMNLKNMYSILSILHMNMQELVETHLEHPPVN